MKKGRSEEETFTQFKNQNYLRNAMPFVYRVSGIDLYFKVTPFYCMTAKQKVKYFKSAATQNELEQINKFISNPKINATGIASSKFGIILLYEEK